MTPNTVLASITVAIGVDEAEVRRDVIRDEVLDKDWMGAIDMGRGTEGVTATGVGAGAGFVADACVCACACGCVSNAICAIFNSTLSRFAATGDLVGERAGVDPAGDLSSMSVFFCSVCCCGCDINDAATLVLNPAIKSSNAEDGDFFISRVSLDDVAADADGDDMRSTSGVKVGNGSCKDEVDLGLVDDDDADADVDVDVNVEAAGVTVTVVRAAGLVIEPRFAPTNMIGWCMNKRM